MQFLGQVKGYYTSVHALLLLAFMALCRIDPGLLATLRDDIVPRLLKDVPDQPSEQQLKDNPYLCRFVLVFDREGYSPAFFQQMWSSSIIKRTVEGACTQRLQASG